MYLFIYGCAGSLLLLGPFSSCGERGGYSLVVVHRLLIAVVSLVEPGLSGALASLAAVPRL